MKPPSVLRVMPRPKTSTRPYHRPKIGRIAALNARRFSATTPRRLFLDECLVQTHTFISGVHDMTGLPWAATIPLVAILVRIVILNPLHAYCNWAFEKQCKRFSQLEESRIAIEKKVQQQHGHKSPLERQQIQNREVNYMRTQVIKQIRPQLWGAWIAAYVKIPMWFTMMETIRRMTGSEDGMLNLAAKSLIPVKAKQNARSGTMDELILTEPSLATEGMLWFDDLMIPDPSLILPFALSGIIFYMFSSGRGTTRFRELGATPERPPPVLSWTGSKNRALKFGAILVGPATLMFPSAMLLYWISSSLAAVIWPSLPLIRFIRFIRMRMTKATSKGKPDENKHKSKPKMQEYHFPTMKDLRNQRKKK